MVGSTLQRVNSIYGFIAMDSESEFALKKSGLHPWDRLFLSFRNYFSPFHMSTLSATKTKDPIKRVTDGIQYIKRI